MTHLNLFLFFLGLVPVSGLQNTEQVTESKPVYQSIQAVDSNKSNDANSKAYVCSHYPFCPGE